MQMLCFWLAPLPEFVYEGRQTLQQLVQFCPEHFDVGKEVLVAGALLERVESLQRRPRRRLDLCPDRFLLHGQRRRADRAKTVEVRESLKKVQLNL